MVVVHRDRRIVAHYGSAAGELAACVSAVGLADRSGLVKLALHGPSVELGRLAAGLAGAAPEPGGVVFSGGAWWCAPSLRRLIVLCPVQPAQRRSGQLREGPAGPGERLPELLREWADQRPAVTLADLSADWAAVAVLGARTRPLLADLGVYGESGNPRRAHPFTAHRVAGTEVLWLLESDRRVTALMPRAAAAAVCGAIERAGRRHGICSVGEEAVARYALLRRRVDAL